MATKSLRPGETIVTNDDDLVVPTHNDNVALAEYTPDERRKGIALWRRAIKEVAAGKQMPERSVLRSVFAQAGGVGDAEAAFGSDLKDYKLVLKGEAAEKQDSLGEFVREHGDRRDLMKQWDACHENLRALKRLLSQHDSLQRVHSLTVHQGQCVRRANKRLWDD